VDFVMRSFERMQGGELFVPKIPSARIVDLATALAPELAQRQVGIRPGEKLHEMMISRDDSPHTLEFAHHYVIAPALSFNQPCDYSRDGLGEQGHPVEPGFEYLSDSNPDYLDVTALRQLVERCP